MSDENEIIREQVLEKNRQIERLQINDIDTYAAAGGRACR